MALPSGVEHIIKKNINGNVTYIFPYSKTHLIWDTARQVYLNHILNDIYNSKQDVLTAGTGISIETDPVTGEVVISNTQTSAEWGNIDGTLSDQEDLWNELTSINNDIDDIEDLVPAQASVNNQLADKDFVNSSISTATATYRGNFNVVTDLNLHYDSSHSDIGNALDNEISIADNNDYSFVKIPTSDTTPTEIFAVERYKYNGTNWLYEYTLNNSGYTAEQWASINSGITDTKVTQYDGYATSKQDTLTPGTGINMVGATISTNNIVWRTW